MHLSLMSLQLHKGGFLFRGSYVFAAFCFEPFNNDIFKKLKRNVKYNLVIELGIVKQYY